MRRMEEFGGFCALLSMAFGAWVLLAWALDLRALTTLPGQAVVKANTGLCLLLIGLALYLFRKPPASAGRSYFWVATACAVTASVVGLLSFVEAWTGRDFLIDHMLFRAGPEDLAASIRPGLMSPISGLAFGLLGPALILSCAKQKQLRWLQQTLAVLVAVVSMFGILDFMVDPSQVHTHIAPTTAVVLLAVALAAVLSSPEWGLGAVLASTRSGGAMARRLLPAGMVLPVLIGWLRWQGQTAGLYTDWTGVALMVIAVMVLLGGLTIWTAHALNRVDRERQRAEESVHRLASIVMSSPDAMISKTVDGIVTTWNAGAEATYGYSAAEMIGRNIDVVIPEDARKDYEALMQTVAEGASVQQYESVRIDRRGNSFPVSISCSAIKDEAGKIVGVATTVRDITERKQAEEKLQKLSIYTRSLIEASLDPLVTISRDGKITDVNEATEKVTGVARQALIGSDFSDYFTEPDKARHGYEEVFASGFVRDYPLVIRHISGQVTDVLYNASVLRNQQGETEGVFAAARDITRRKEAEAALHKASLYVRSLIEASLDPLVTISQNGKIMDVNRAAELATGVDRGRLIGSDFCDHFTEPEKARRAYERVFAEERIRDYPLALRDASGKVMEVLFNASVFRNELGEVEGVFAAARDMTERNQAERELRLSRERLALAQKAGHSGTFDWDLRDNSVIWTPEAEEVYGVGPGGFGNSYEDWESRVFPEDLPAAKAAIAESLQTGSYAAQFRIRRHNDGEVRWIDALGIVIFDKERHPVRMLGINMDMTERKRAEQAVRELNQELEKRVEMRTAELTAANRELEAFTYSVSHDLRAPLRHIGGFSRILMEDFAPTLPPEMQRHLQRIEQGTTRMGQLVDDLLNLTRVGRRAVSLQVSGLESLVREVVTGLESDCSGRDVEWRVHNLPFVECDSALMKQVFQNLLSNALKFTRPRAQAIIEVGQMEGSSAPVVYVRDNGVGFSMKYADKLFGVFQRLHRSEDFEGTGVGLATVQRIIHKHGGRIWAQAELDKGATFYFTLGDSEAQQPQHEETLIGANA